MMSREPTKLKINTQHVPLRQNAEEKDYIALFQRFIGSLLIIVLARTLLPIEDGTEVEF
jgi:hypothetical protein